MLKLCVDAEVAAIRAFNGFYTRKIGVVDGIASSPFFSCRGSRVV